MGLDMYLEASRYFGGWEHSNEKERMDFCKVAGAAGLDPATDVTSASPSITASATVLYWRKANAIHNWFVQNVQGGQDECQESYVSREQLEELAGLCETVLANREQAQTLLPPTGGCFFGSTEIDADYYEDLKHTAEGIRRILGNPNLEKWEFYYNASW